MTKETENTIIVLFDGVCNLCNGAVQFIIRRDRKNIFRFASLQSDFARNLLPRYGVSPDALQSIVVFKNGVLYQKSDAVLVIGAHLRGYSVLARLCKSIPATLRNGLYDIIAKRRYAIFGKRNECMIPDPQISHRFL